MDFLLADAIRILEGERCSQCGLPVYICHNDDTDLGIKVEYDQCSAKEAVENDEARAKQAAGDKYKPTPGEARVPRAFLYSGGDPASLRESYYRAQAEKRRMLLEDSADA